MNRDDSSWPPEGRALYVGGYVFGYYLVLAAMATAVVLVVKGIAGRVGRKTDKATPR